MIVLRGIALIAVTLGMTACATLTEDAMTPIAMSFSDGSAGDCQLMNKRGAWSMHLPGTVSIRKSDDALKYQCETTDGRKAVGAIESEMGAKIVASAVFLDLGITDAITDKHRKYAGSFVIPVEPNPNGPTSKPTSISDEIEKLNDLRARGLLSDDEFDAEKKKLLNRG